MFQHLQWRPAPPPPNPAGGLDAAWSSEVRSERELLKTTQNRSKTTQNRSKPLNSYVASGLVMRVGRWFPDWVPGPLGGESWHRLLGTPSCVLKLFLPTQNLSKSLREYRSNPLQTDSKSRESVNLESFLGNLQSRGLGFKG